MDIFSLIAADGGSSGGPITIKDRYPPAPDNTAKQGQIVQLLLSGEYKHLPVATASPDGANNQAGIYGGTSYAHLVLPMYEVGGNHRFIQITCDEADSKYIHIQRYDLSPTGQVSSPATTMQALSQGNGSTSHQAVELVELINNPTGDSFYALVTYNSVNSWLYIIRINSAGAITIMSVMTFNQTLLGTGANARYIQMEALDAYNYMITIENFTTTTLQAVLVQWDGNATLTKLAQYGITGWSYYHSRYMRKMSSTEVMIIQPAQNKIGVLYKNGNNISFTDLGAAYSGNINIPWLLNDPANPKRFFSIVGNGSNLQIDTFTINGSAGSYTLSKVTNNPYNASMDQEIELASAATTYNVVAPMSNTVKPNHMYEVGTSVGSTFRMISDDLILGTFGCSANSRYWGVAVLLKVNANGTVTLLDNKRMEHIATNGSYPSFQPDKTKNEFITASNNIIYGKLTVNSTLDKIYWSRLKSIALMSGPSSYTAVFYIFGEQPHAISRYTTGTMYSRKLSGKYNPGGIAGVLQPDGSILRIGVSEGHVGLSIGNEYGYIAGGKGGLLLKETYDTISTTYVTSIGTAIGPDKIYVTNLIK